MSIWQSFASLFSHTPTLALAAITRISLNPLRDNLVHLAIVSPFFPLSHPALTAIMQISLNPLCDNRVRLAIAPSPDKELLFSHGKHCPLFRPVQGCQTILSRAVRNSAKFAWQVSQRRRRPLSLCSLPWPPRPPGRRVLVNQDMEPAV